MYDINEVFSSPCLGILFSLDGGKDFPIDGGTVFSSPCLGILFSQISGMSVLALSKQIFVPMFGDSFFTAGPGGPTGWALYGPFAAGISN